MQEIARNYELVKLNRADSEYTQKLYDWHISETMNEKFSCRPVRVASSIEEYLERISNQIENGVQIYVLRGKENSGSNLYGKISIFDYNPRNRSAEFGYYLPLEFRNQGIGKLMVAEFLATVFSNEELELNKLYATTASGNIASIRLLEGFRFILDGRLREHYWIGEEKQDQLVYSLLKREWFEEI